MYRSMAASAFGLMALASTAVAAGPTCPASNGHQYRGPQGNIFEIECGIDYRGGDIGSVTVNSLEGCILACDTNPRCVNVSLSGVACYLKGTLGTRLRASDIRSARKITPVTNPPPACPASNGKSFVSTSSHNFTIECDTDHAGGDLRMVSVEDLEGCINACGNETRCVDVSLSGEACYLKSSIGQALSRPGINGAIKGQRVPAPEPVITTTSTTSSTAKTTSTSTRSSSSTSVARTVVPCPSNETEVVANSFARFFTYQDYQAAGASTASRRNVANITTCLNLCDRNDGCDAANLSENGLCTLQKAADGCYFTPGISGARLVTPRPQCPAASGTTYTTMNSEEFEIACDQDFAGKDIYAFDTDSPSGNGGAFGECLEACSTYDGCYAVTLQGAGCYLKGYPVPVSSAAKGLLSGRLLNATAPGPSPEPEVPETSDVMAPLDVGKFDILGCYEDDRIDRLLADATEYDTPNDSFSVTAETCADFCDDYTYFGLEYGGECFCGSNFAYAPVAAGGQCNYVCKANSSQTCGGEGAIQVYRVAAYFDPEPTATAEPVILSSSLPSSSIRTTSSVAATTDISSLSSISSNSSTSTSIASPVSSTADVTSLTSISTTVPSIPAATFTTITDYITITNGTLTRYGPTPSRSSYSTVSTEITTPASASTPPLPPTTTFSISGSIPRPSSNATAIAQNTGSTGLSTTALPTLTSLIPSVELPFRSSNATTVGQNPTSNTSITTSPPTLSSLDRSVGIATPSLNVTTVAGSTSSVAIDTDSVRSITSLSPSVGPSSPSVNATAIPPNITPISVNMTVLPTLPTSSPSFGFPAPSNGSIISIATSYSSSASAPPVPLPSPVSVEIEEPLTIVVTPLPSSGQIEGPAPIDTATGSSEATTASSETPTTVVIPPVLSPSTIETTLGPITATVVPVPAEPSFPPTGSLVLLDEPVPTVTVTPIPADPVDEEAPSTTDSPVVVDAEGNSTSPSSRLKARGASPGSIRRDLSPVLGM